LHKKNARIEFLIPTFEGLSQGVVNGGVDFGVRQDSRWSSLGDKDAAHIEFRLDNVQIEGVGVECETRASLHRVIQIPYYNIEFLIAIFQLHPACSHNVHLHIFKARN
jgi:hypothetical protein